MNPEDFADEFASPFDAILNLDLRSVTENSVTLYDVYLLAHAQYEFTKNIHDMVRESLVKLDPVIDQIMPMVYDVTSSSMFRMLFGKVGK